MCKMTLGVTGLLMGAMLVMGSACGGGSDGSSSGGEAAPGEAQAVFVDGNVIEVHPVTGGAVFVASTDADGTEMWGTDGTAEGTTMVLETVPGEDQNHGSVLGVIDGEAIFVVSDGGDGGIVYALSASSSRVVAELDSEPLRSSMGGASNASSDNHSYFVTIDENLWSTDGTEAGTVKLGALPGRPQGMAATDSMVFISFSSFDVEVDDQAGLWASDNSPGNVAQVAPVDFFSTGELNGGDSLMYFWGSSDAEGDEVWVSDGSEEGTHVVADLAAGNGGIFIEQMLTMGDTLYFSINADSSEGDASLGGLWKTDGTEQGTTQLLETPDSSPEQFLAMGDQLLFSTRPLSSSTSNGPAHWGRLLRSDGTAAGTTEVTHFRETDDNSWFVPSLRCASADKAHILYMNRVWQTDGTEAGTQKLFEAGEFDVAANVGTSSSESLSFDFEDLACGQNALFAIRTVKNTDSDDQSDELWFVAH